MSVKALDAVFERSKAAGAAFTVLIAMADWADHQGRCYPSFAQIARKARVFRSSVATAIRDLTALGELERVTRGHGPTTADEDDDPQTVRSQWRNVYRILLIRRPKVVQPAGDEVDQQPDDQVGQPDDHQPEISTDPPQVGQSPDHLKKTGSPIDCEEVVQSTDAHIRKEPSVDPSEELKAGASPRPPDEIQEKPDDNLGVITKLVHESIDVLGFQFEDGEIAERVKRRCAELGILYDTAVVWKALDSARFQRQRRRPA